MSAKPDKHSTSTDKQAFVRFATWLIDETCLTFDQISQCCQLSIEEVQNIADTDEEIYIQQYDPLKFGIITEEEITDCQNNTNKIPKLSINNLSKMYKSNSAHTQPARRRDKQNAILFLTKNFPILENGTIAKLFSTTGYIVEQIRTGIYHNIKNIKPQDPVLIGLCTQENLDKVLEKAQIEKERQERLAKIIIGG